MCKTSWIPSWVQSRIPSWFPRRATSWIPFWISLGLLGILSLSDMVAWAHLGNAYSIFTPTISRFEELVFYFPFASHFEWASLWGMITDLWGLRLSGVEPGALSLISPFPVVTYAVYGALFSLLRGCWPLFLMGVRFLPAVGIFWLLTRIYALYIPKLWAGLFAFFGVTYIASFSYWQVIVDFISNGTAPSSLFFEITRAPLPSLSLIAFCALLWLTIRSRTYTLSQVVCLSLGWGIQWWVFAYNGIFGSLFWIGMIIVSAFLYDRKTQIGRLQKLGMSGIQLGVQVGIQFGIQLLIRLAIAVGISGLFFLPMWMAKTQYPLLYSTYLDSVTIPVSGWVTTDWGLLAYGIPLILLAAVIGFKCSDYYELWVKFYPVFLIILCEIVVLNLHWVMGPVFQPSLFSTRIGVFVTRFFYLIPIVYFLRQPDKRLVHTAPNTRVRQHLSAAISWMFRFEKPIIVSIVTIMIGVLGAGHLAQMRHWSTQYETTIASYNRIQDMRNILFHNHVLPPARIVAQQIDDQVILSNVWGYSSLVMPIPSHFMLPDIAFAYLSVYFKLANWPLQNAQQFMDPRLLHLSDQFDSPGLGYWMIYHHRPLDDDTGQYLDIGLLSAYQGLDVSVFAAHTPIDALILDTPDPTLTPARYVQGSDSYHVYTFPKSPHDRSPL